MKRLRADLDLTQEALAEAAGCAPQTIRSFESGARRPSRDLAERIAEVLQVPADQQADFVRLARAAGPPSAPSVAHEQPQRSDAARPDGRNGTTGGQVAPEHRPILATKLFVPRPRAGLVSRPRLLARLDDGLAGPLTVIAAPAGSGKTSVLADWLSRQQEGGIKVAWLALDAGDSDPSRFLRYLVAALQTIDPWAGTQVLALLGTAERAGHDALLLFLANDLASLPARTVLVLDDYHVIDAPAVHEVLQFLLDYLPPQLHLVIASRVDPPLPLARLRARGQLTELRAHDLRFTPEEATSFLRDAMGLALPAEDVAALETRTEGWVAGLQLAALSLQNRPPEQQAEFIDAFTGSHRFVVDYLVEEVLARQPQHVQTFLLQTSILERLSGPLCDAVVLGEAGATTPARGIGQEAYSQLLLEDLERRNLFIIPLDTARHWYRYHHLFAQVLRERLLSGASRETVLMLNRRAVASLEQQGLLDDAVRQAFAESDLEGAAELIERHGIAMIDRGEHVLVRRWVEQMPPGLLETRPRLGLVAGWILASLSRFDALDHLLQTATHAPGAADVPMDVLGEMAVLRATSARFQEEYATALELAHEALRLLPAELPAGRARALFTVGVCLMHFADMAGAEAALVEAAALAQAAGNLATALIARYWLATLYERQARLQDTLRTCEQAIQAGTAGQGAPPPFLGAAYVGLGNVWYERNSLDRAQPPIIEGLELLGGSIEHYIVGTGYATLARIHQARGDGEAALAALEEAEAWASRMQLESWRFRALLAAYRARLWLRQGNLAAAIEWAADSGLDDEPRLNDVRYFTLVRVRLAKYRRAPKPGGLDDMATLVTRLLAMAEEHRSVRLRIELLMLQALLVQAQGNMEGALGLLASALVLATPEGYVRLFVDEGPAMAALLQAGLDRHGWGTDDGPQGRDLRGYAHRLLAALEAEGMAAPAGPQPAPLAATPVVHSGAEPLTARELEVLRLLAHGRSNQAIADELIVAVGTVKRHVNSILGKLQAQSRLEAVARARELELL